GDFSASVYESLDRAIVSFGDYFESTNVAYLSSYTGAAWTLLDTGPGPTARFRNSGVYDAAHGRAVFYGGEHNNAGDFQSFDDAWALVFSAVPYWEPLEPSGKPPAARNGHVAIYDPEGQRMIVYGGSAGTDANITRYTDLWALSLDDS